VGLSTAYSDPDCLFVHSAATAKKSSHGHAHVPAHNAHADPSTQSSIDQLTSLASALLATNVDIYSETHESLLRSIRAKGNVGPDWVPPKKEVKYEYRWAIEADIDAMDDGKEREVFGPFGENEMREWFGAAYFGTSGEMIEVRVVGKDWGTWDEVIGS
jgi:CD2 antigen cytoplasmic tail-binding protein 2